jgi:hypothetical protein
MLVDEIMMKLFIRKKYEHRTIQIEKHPNEKKI